MEAKIIVVLNQKGGCGKTTVTIQTGGTLALRGKKVLIIDGDKQNSAVEWAAMASDECSFPASVINLSATGKTIHREIKKFYHDYEYIFVDCPPAEESPISKSALLVADLALVPFIPDGINLRPAVRIRDVIEDAQIMNKNLNCLLLLNRVEPKTNLTQTVIDLLPEFNIPISDVTLHKRTSYAETYFSGSTVHSLRSKAKDAIKEIEDFANSLLQVLHCPNEEILAPDKVITYE